MAGTARVPGTELTGVKGGLLKLAIRRKLGEVPESVEVMWHHPAVFMDLMRMGTRTEKWDRLDSSLASFAVMAAAAEIGCSFCLDFNYFRAPTPASTRRRRGRCRDGGSRRSSLRWSDG